MSLSNKKTNKIEMKRRASLINSRSLDGKGYFMDASVEATVSLYLETGNPDLLKNIPDYRKIKR